MTAERKVDEDGQLRPALQALEDAISMLIDPRQQFNDGKRYWTDSWYDQLIDACPGAQGQHHNPHAGSVVPFWVDAVELRQEIDSAVGRFQKDPGPFDGDLSAQRPPTPETVRRLRLILKRGFRPQDCRIIYDIVDACKDWVTRIDDKLNPVPMRTLWDADDSKKWAACPQCGANDVWVHDPASHDGKPIRKPALEMDPSGFTKCANKHCRAEWSAPFILCGMLGYDLPAGMEELREVLGIQDPE